MHAINKQSDVTSLESAWNKCSRALWILVWTKTGRVALIAAETMPQSVIATELEYLPSTLSD